MISKLDPEAIEEIILSESDGHGIVLIRIKFALANSVLFAVNRCWARSLHLSFLGFEKRQ